MSIYDKIAQAGNRLAPATAYAQGQQANQQFQANKLAMQGQEIAQRQAIRQEIARGIEWADTPEKFDQVVDYYTKQGVPGAEQYRGKFDMREQILAMTQQKQAPKYTFIEAGAEGGKRQLLAINEANPRDVTPVGSSFESEGSQGDKLSEFYAKEGYKDVRKMNEDASQAQAGINDIDRFLSLNESNATGPAMAIPGVTGIRSAFDADVAEMKSISDKLTPQMRQGMPGAASDRDVAMFRGATISIDKPYEANKNIGLGLKAANQNKVDRKDFMNAYYQSNRSLVGAEQKWQEYLNANPIFDPKAKKGSYDLNPNRKSWQEHFGVQQVQQPAQTPQDGEIKFLGFE